MCEAWDSTSHTCPAGKMRMCPSYQNRVGQEKHCGKVPGPGTAPYCRPGDSACAGKASACRDEEFYPGCGALETVVAKVKDTDASPDKTFTLGQADGISPPKKGLMVESIYFEGTYVNLFDDANIKKIADNTCDVLCPCKTKKVGCVFDMAGYKGYGFSKCSADDFAAYTDCRTAYKTKNSPQWANMYSSNAQYGTEYSTPVMFQVDKITVKTTSDGQTTFMKANCPCGDASKWSKGTARDITKCTLANCKYLGSKGLFSISPEPNCPAGKHCLFASIYRHQGVFLYISRMESTFASAVKSPIYSDGIYTLSGGANDCLSAASTLKGSFMYAGVLALVVSLWQRL